MLVEKIRIDGFRNIDNTEIKFNNSITALVGLNNYGKSNILNGISFALNFIRADSNLKQALMSDEISLPINKKTAYRDFYFEIEFSDTINDKKIYTNYEYSFEWIKNKGKGSVIKKECLKIRDSNSKKYTTYIRRTMDACSYKSSETGRCDSKLRIANNELALNKLKHYDNLFYYNLVESIHNIKIELNNFYDPIYAFNNIPFFQIRGINQLDLNRDFGNNIGEVLYSIKENYKEKYELLINSFMSLIDNIEYIEPICTDLKNDPIFPKIFNENLITKESNNNNDVPFIIPEKYYTVIVKETYNNQQTTFQNVSNGTKRMFLLLTSAIVADIKKIPLIAFEELENSIHPYLFQKLIILLSEIVTNCRVLFTSHSPYLIQYFDLDNIYIGVPSIDRTAVFKKVKKQLYNKVLKNSQNEGISTGDYLFNLLVDSYSDNSELCSYLECN